MSTLREYEQTLERDPTLNEPFLALRKAYRESGTWDKLVTLYELRAQALPEPDTRKASELFYLAAEVRLDHLNDAEGAEADLAHAIDRDPDNAKAAHRLKLIYREQDRLAEYMTMLELEASAVGRARGAGQPADPARVAELSTELGQFCKDSFARLERAVALPASQREKDATPEALKLVESARKIYRALGDMKSVVRLYELELGLTAEAKRRSDLLLGLGRVLGEKLGDLEGAAQRLGEVVRLRPRDDRALEALATVYANPAWIGADGKDRAAAIYYQIARRRQEAADIDNAVAALRKALGAVPGHPESSQLIEQVLYSGGRLVDLDLYYRERVAEAKELEEKMDFLFKRAQLAETDRRDMAEALRIYQEIVEIEPAGGPASQRLVELFTEKQDYARLAELREKQLSRVPPGADPGLRVALLLDLATLYRDRLGDPEQAAVCWHAVLQEDPNHPEALPAYAEHFRNRGDFPALIELLEFSFDHARGVQRPVPELLERLEEIAVIAERNLSDTERALSAWQRMDELSPGHDRAREAQKRILQKGKQWDRMVAVLEREAEIAVDPAVKAESLRRLARVLIEKLQATDRASAVYRQILVLEPKDPVANRALLELYEKEERWGELAAMLRAQLESSATKQEKVGTLRRLLVLYQDKLGQMAEASWASAEILKLAPGDPEALERQEAILERGDDKTRLVETLEYHTRYAASNEEKLRLCLRIAELLQKEVGDHERAIKWWEEILALQPGDATALDALVEGYDKLGKGEELARVLELQIGQPSQDLNVQTNGLRRLAKLFTDRLQDPARAQKAWEDLLRVTPSDPEALEALSGIYANKGDWRTLVGILERRIPLQTDAAQAVVLALERARIFEDELRIRGEAMSALEQIVEELDPRCLPAFERLRRLAEAGGDWDKVVAAAEKQLFLEDDPNRKSARALEIGELYRDRLSDPARAITAFERAVEIDPYQLQGHRALSALYAGASEWQRLILTDEKLLDLSANDPAEIRRLMFEIAETAEKRVGDPRLSFEWYKRAHAETGDPEALVRLEQVSEAHQLWDALVEVYEAARAKATEPAEQVAISRKIARLYEEALEDPGRAFAVLKDALTAEPAGETLLPEVERLAAGAGDWEGLLEVYAQVSRNRPSADDRLALLQRRAGVRESKLGDPAGALKEHLAAFALAPEHEVSRQEILRLAEVTGRWEDALSVEAQRFSRATAVADKVEIAARAAGLTEHKLLDRRRAFRAYLNAFRLAPDNEVLVAHLWRLAALVDPAPETAVEIAEELIEEVVELSGEYALPASAGRGSDDDAGIDRDEETDVDHKLELRERPAVPPPTPPPLTKTPSPTALSTWAEFAQAYELLPAADAGVRHQHLRKVAEIWERGARNIDKAITTLERAFRLDPGSEPVRVDLRRIASETSRWDQICAVFQKAADTAPREDAVALHHEVARFREELGQQDKAEACYQAILVLKPEDLVALDRVEGLLRSQQRWAELASLLDKRITGTLEALPAGTLRRQRSRELADLYDLRLERPYEAIDAYERYVASVEEDGLGPDHPDVVQGNAEALEALTRLYSRVGMWGKASESLARQIDLTPEVDLVRPLRLRLAEIAEKELGQVDQAVAAYEAILEESPRDTDVLGSLDRLLESQARWPALEEVIGRRVELASGAERSELIRRRARILEERIGNPDAAAACLRALGAEALRDEATVTALLRNLGRAGLAHEALRVLDQRIELLTGEGATRQKIAGLHLDAAALRLDRLDDPAGARAAIEQALALCPDSAEALGALARLHLSTNDFAAYASTRRREAEALRSSGTLAAEAFVDAGRVYRDQLESPAEARLCFDQAARSDPRNTEALRALASLLTAEGEMAEARALYERQLDLVDEPAAKAAVLTDLARSLLAEKPGELGPAIARLDQALDLSPDYLPAVVTMADLYFREQQWAEAERRLLQAIRRMRGQPADMAQLYHRLGEVYEKLGRLDDGYKHLQEAERMMPGQLLIRLALGENRYQAKKWREAVSSLEGLGEHNDAGRYPLEVAEGLSHAAAAEVRLKRPERAVALYEAALRSSADHRPSLQALAELARERGQQAVAAQYLRRLAEGSGDRGERARLFEQLGDVLHSLLDDEGARRAYNEALAQVETPTVEQIPLYDKALAVQRRTGAVKEAAQSLEQLIALSSDPQERAARRREAAVLMEEQGEFGRAGELLEAALGESPKDENVLAGVVAAYERAKRRKELEAVLTSRLPGLDPVVDHPKARARRAELWEKLGELRRKKDKRGAVEALETAVSIERGRVSARVLLAKLYGDQAENAEAALRNHHELVRADIAREDSLRTLAHSYLRAGRTDWARCCFEVLELLGLDDKEDRAFLAAHPAPSRRPEDPYAASIEEGEGSRLLAHPDARLMSELFATIWEGVPGLGGPTLESLGLTSLDKVSPISDAAIGQIFGQVAKAFGNRRASLYVSPPADNSSITILLTPPPAIVIGPSLVDQDPATLRFLVGRALELARPEYILGAAMPGADFAQLFISVLKAFHPRHAKWRAGETSAASVEAQKLKKALPYKVAKRLAELFQEYETTPWSSAHWRRVVHETGNRAGLLACGDLRTAASIVYRENQLQNAVDADETPGPVNGAPSAGQMLEAARRPGPLRELLRFALSEEHFTVRELLGTAVPRAVAA
jgi:golgin subfamily B member 1